MDLAAQGKDLGSLGLLGAHGSEPLRTVEDDLGNVGVGLHIVQDGRLLEQAFERRERRTRTGLPAVSFDGRHQRRLLPAYKRAGTETEPDVKFEAGSENVIPQKAQFPGLADGNLQTLHRNWVLRTYIDVPLCRADGVAGNGHGFQNRMGIAFQNGTVHERARVAFVRVAADILLIRLVGSRELPLQSCGESRAAASPQAAVRDELDNLLRGHLGEHLAQRLIAAYPYVFFDVLRADLPAVAQSHPVLLLIEIGLLQRQDVFGLGGLLIQKPLHHIAVFEMLGNDLRDILFFYHGIKRAFRMYDHDRPQGAQAEASGLYDLYILLQAVGLDFLFQLFNDPQASRRSTARTSAHMDTVTAGMLLRFFPDHT